jgi:hypothetical protein
VSASTTFRLRVLLLLAIAGAAAAWLFSLPPIPQLTSYHNFADDRTLLGVPNALNVLSNLPFLFVGVWGLLFLASPEARRPDGPVEEPTLRAAYAVLFVGVALTAFGSAYYHLEPDNRRLFWDRLPMAIAFMGLFAAMIAERIDVRAGAFLLMPLVTTGVWSTLYWRETDDLRPYYYMQFFPLAVLPLMLSLFPARYTRTADLAVALGWYVASKIFEHPFDRTVYDMGNIVSGHTLKHLCSAMGVYVVLRMLQRRVRIHGSPLSRVEKMEKEALNSPPAS